MAVDYDEFNPIRQVGTSLSSLETIKFTPAGGGAQKFCRAPASYLWKLEDVSAADSGRTEDTQMWKARVGQVRGIELGWTNLPTEEASAILNAFNPEYVYVWYLDLQLGAYATAEFYVGNRSAPLYNTRLNVWQNLKFNLIQRNGQASPVIKTR